MQQKEQAKLTGWPKKINIPVLHKQFGSPAWIVCEKQLAENVGGFAAFTEANSRIYYPVKTNPSLTILQLLAKFETGADCASQLEINLALFAGIKIENISYNSPAQDTGICKSLLMAGATVVMDDPVSIAELQIELSATAVKGKLYLRINLPDAVGYSHANDNQELMAHGNKSSKFGIPAEELESIFEQITLPVSGFHVHVGTQMDNMHSFESAIRKLNVLASEWNTKGQKITGINVGGGLGIPFNHSQEFPSLECWCKKMAALKDPSFLYSAEPGHALVGNAVALLTSVLTIKNSRGKKWAIADVGTDQLTKVTLLKWPHRILSESGDELPEGSDAVAGPLCFAGDTLADHINVKNLKKGSPLLITEAGAYTFSLSNKFNGRTAPKWLLLKPDGEVIQTMEKESLYDELQHARYEWNTEESFKSPGVLTTELANKLSSIYLRQSSNDDTFTYESIFIESRYTYRFAVSTTSLVDFISMPFAIRIMGDATIISLLHKCGYEKKDFAVWGRKLTMDCFDQVNSNEILEFTISLSEMIKKDESCVLVSRFRTNCGRCVGSFIISFENRES
jgi:diaminopimelate decarboxylase